MTLTGSSSKRGPVESVRSVKANGMQTPRDDDSDTEEVITEDEDGGYDDDEL